MVRNMRSPKNQSTSQHIMNMDRPKSATTFATILRPFRRSIGITKHRRKRGTNALFRAISAEDWDLVITICDAKPYKAECLHSAKGFFDAHRNSEILPIHQACVFHPTKMALTHLVYAYPASIQIKETGYGRLPLHIACHSSASFDAIQFLMQEYKEAIYETDVVGRVPLHYALSNGASVKLVREILHLATEAGGEDGAIAAASAADFSGWTPLHVACHMGSSTEILQILVQTYPEGVNLTTRKGSTPKTLLAKISLPVEKRRLMEAVLQGEKIHDDNDNNNGSMEKLLHIGDETVHGSHGITLDLKDDDASSCLSSIADSAATIRTGTTQSLTKTPSNKNNNEQQHHLRSKENSQYLPTHRAYLEEERNNGLQKQGLSERQKAAGTFALGAGHSSSDSPPRKSLRNTTMSAMPQDGGGNVDDLSDDLSLASSTSGEEKAPEFQPITHDAHFC